MSRILVVDDDPVVIAALGVVLDSYDLDAVTASDRSTAEEMVANAFFPVILADLRLRTEEEGFALLESIRRISPRSRVASMTGYTTAETETRLRELGSRLVLQKPIANEQLVTVLREMLEEVERATEETGDDLDAVYRQTIDTLRRITCGRYRFTAGEAEELIQEAWCLFLTKRRSIREPKAWLSGTIANLCRQAITQRVRERDHSAEMPDVAATTAKDEVIAIHQGLAKLDARSRLLCEWIGLEQRSYDEVSVAARIPIGSIGPLYIRAKNKLRTALGGAD